MDDERVAWRALIDTVERKLAGTSGRDMESDASAHMTLNSKYDKDILTEASKLRLSPMDNIRTTAIFLLVIQYAITGAISSHPDTSNLEGLSRGSYIAMTVFVMMSRLITVPVLFFVSGFSSRFSLEMHGRTVIQFLLRKTFRTVLAVAAYQAVARFSKFIHGSLPELNVNTPYYASQEGRDALLNGPAFYVLTVLILDYMYALFWSVKKLVIGDHHFFRNHRRFNIFKYATVYLLINWVIARTTVLIPRSLPAWVQKWLYLTNSPEPHFPFIYLIAYLAGVQFATYYKFVFEDRKRHGLASAITLSVFGLGLHYYFWPSIISQYLDIRSHQPQLDLMPKEHWQPYSLPPLYAYWVVLSIIFIGEGLITAFFTNTRLMANWGTFSRYSYIQIYVQLFFVGGLSMKFIYFYTNNVLIQALVTAFLSLCSGYCLQIVVHSLLATDEDGGHSEILAK